MANRWGNNGNSDKPIFLGSKITADGNCSHEIKRHLLLWKKAMTSQDSILKSRDITLPELSLVAQRVKHLAAMWETQVRSLGQEDPLEREMATHSSTLAWKNPMDREAW